MNDGGPAEESEATGNVSEVPRLDVAAEVIELLVLAKRTVDSCVALDISVVDDIGTGEGDSTDDMLVVISA